MSNYFNTLPDEISRHVYKYINPIKTYTRHLNNLKKRFNHSSSHIKVFS